MSQLVGRKESDLIQMGIQEVIGKYAGTRVTKDTAKQFKSDVFKSIMSHGYKEITIPVAWLIVEDVSVKVMGEINE